MAQYNPINSDDVFSFSETSMTVNNMGGTYSIPFNTVFKSKINFLDGNNPDIENIYITPNNDEVFYDIVTEGGSSVKTYNISAITMPDYDIEVLYATSATATTGQVCCAAGVENIEYAEIDGVQVTINTGGTVTFPTQKQYHKGVFKIKETGSSQNFFSGCSTIISCKINTEIVGTSCFKECSNLYEIAFCKDVRSIGAQAAYGCLGLVRIILPKNIEYIGNYAFGDCEELNEYYILSSPTQQIQFGTTPFYGNADDRYIYSETDLSGTPIWNNIASGSQQTDWEEWENGGNDTYIGEYTTDAARALSYNSIMENNNKVQNLHSVLTIYQDKLKIYGEYSISLPINLTLNRGNEEYISYKIYNKNDLIYNGKIYCPSNSINLILNELLETYITAKEPVKGSTSIYKTIDYALFKFEYSTDDWLTTNELDGILKVYNDWSYDTLTTNGNVYVNDKIYDKIPIYLTYRLNKDVTATITVLRVTTGGTETVITTTSLTQCTVGITLYPVVTPELSFYAVIISPTGSTPKTWLFYPNRADARLTLLYRTKAGGFGELYFNRTSKKQVNYTISTFNQNSTNKNAILTKQYKKDYTEVWTCNTDWISDNDSNFVADVFASTECYFINKNDDVIYGFDIIKCNITNTSAQVKKYFSNGRKFNQYQFTIEIADKKKIL